MSMQNLAKISTILSPTSTNLTEVLDLMDVLKNTINNAFLSMSNSTQLLSLMASYKGDMY
jgi:hypothetical protein